MFASLNNNRNVVSLVTPMRRFVVGQDPAGRWVAVEPHGLAGGIFINRKAALDYAGFESDHRPGAVLLANHIVELAL